MKPLSHLSPAGRVARAQGLFNVIGGAWPILSLRSFEWVYGRKREDWLQKTSGGLLLASGIALLAAEDSSQSLRTARHIGVGVALTYLIVDLVYIPKGRLRKTYIQDVVCEIGWLVAWSKATGPAGGTRNRT